MGEYKGGISKSTVLRQRLPIIILARAKQPGFGAMQYALPHSGAPGSRGIDALSPGCSYRCKFWASHIDARYRPPLRCRFAGLT
jgi:hypothetical protein